MQVTEAVKKCIEKAVSVSMRIEGYAAKSDAELRKQAKVLMESRGVKVSIPAK